MSSFAEREVFLPDAPLSGAGEQNLTETQKLAVEEELRKLLRSAVFVQSDRLSRFLSFAVSMTLEGKGDELKEYTIGIEAYGRRPDFDPSQDSIVRTEARRLRAKLKKYYQEEGCGDSTVFAFSPGSYKPAFRFDAIAGNCPSQARSAAHPERCNDLTMKLAPFAYLAGDAFGEACARGLTDELMHRLTRMRGIRLFACAEEPAELQADNRLNSWMTSEGFVRTEGDRIRVTCRLHDEHGLHVASWRFDVEVKSGELFVTLERLASEIVICLIIHVSGTTDRPVPNNLDAVPQGVEESMAS